MSLLSVYVQASFIDIFGFALSPAGTDCAFGPPYNIEVRFPIFLRFSFTGYGNGATALGFLSLIGSAGFLRSCGDGYGLITGPCGLGCGTGCLAFDYEFASFFSADSKSPFPLTFNLLL